MYTENDLQKSGFSFLNSSGQRLGALYMEPAHTPPRGTVVLFHGYSHNLNCLFALDYHIIFLEQGFAVCGLNLRGHGNSEGARVQVCSVDAYVADFRDFFAELAVRGAVLERLVLIGFSLGGNIALRFSLCEEVSLHVVALVLLAPLLEFSQNLYYQRTFAEPPIRLLNNYWPDLTWVSFRPGSALGGLKGVDKVRSQRGFELEGHVSVRSMVHLFAAVRDAERMAPTVDVPVLLIHGDKDAITCYETTKRFFAKLGSKNKQLVKLKDKGHYFVLPDAALVGRLLNNYAKNLLAD